IQSLHILAQAGEVRDLGQFVDALIPQLLGAGKRRLVVCPRGQDRRHELLRLAALSRRLPGVLARPWHTADDAVSVKLPVRGVMLGPAAASVRYQLRHALRISYRLAARGLGAAVPGGDGFFLVRSLGTVGAATAHDDSEARTA